MGRKRRRKDKGKSRASFGMGPRPRGWKKRRVGDERLAYPSKVGDTLELAKDCQAITRAGRQCSRPASILLGGRSVCEQHAYTGAG